MARSKGPKYERIVAAVGGDEMAIDEIVRHFEPMIDAESGGDKEVREFIIAELRTAGSIMARLLMFLGLCDYSLRTGNHISVCGSFWRFANAATSRRLCTFSLR